MAETTLDELQTRKEQQARTLPRMNSFAPQEVYRMSEQSDWHTPFTPSNMAGEELQLVDAELSQLFGDPWCHQQSPNAMWNLFYLNHMHYTVGEWLMGRDSNWLEGPPWLKVSLAQYSMPDGSENPYAFLLEDDEVQILLSGPDAKLLRPAT